ncbi:MAG: hypothetical protein QY331_02000 [Melioribacteraceae bacterium]|nr:MAG: hypothetical protein QY331_02000 [Melioribacteraceae bacterium]
MPIEVAIWDITKGKIEKVDYTSIDSEKKLEEIILKDISIISDDLMLIGNQVITSFGKQIDMLAVNMEGKITVLELKKNKTPRDVVAQTLDYASWVQNLSYKEIVEIYKEKNKGKDFETDFNEKFDVEPPEELNQEHDIIIISSELDNETERIINYLSDNYNVPINAVFFRYFHQEGKEFISRSWLIDPNEVIEKVSKTKMKSKSESWNGKDFVANVDAHEEISSWPDCIKYGFISAGGGRWYSRTLFPLFPGARVFAYIPGKGYVGVGTVKEKATQANKFTVTYDGKETSILDVPLTDEGLKNFADDEEKAEYFVRVEWEKTVPESEAYKEKGMRANQNSAFKLKSEFTLEKLIKFFGLDE